MAPRGRGGKFSKPTRGGGKHFSRDVQPVDKDGNPLGLWRDPEDEEESSEEEDQDESSDEESSDEEQTGPSQVGPEEMTREQRKAAAKAKKEAAIKKKSKYAAQPGDLPPTDSEEEEDDELPANPNHSAKSRSQTLANSADQAPPKKKEGGKNELSRREREALEAQQARERYMKLHMEGKTDEARADLERLKLVRERREAEKARREAEKEERDAQQKERQEQISEREKKLREAALGKPRGGKKSSKN